MLLLTHQKNWQLLRSYDHRINRRATKFRACQPVNTEHRGQDQEIIVSYILLNKFI
jgi:hypothetical protein